MDHDDLPLTDLTKISKLSNNHQNGFKPVMIDFGTQTEPEKELFINLFSLQSIDCNLDYNLV